MPTPANYASYMKSFEGRGAAIDENGFIADMQWLPKVVACIVDTTVTRNQSGTIFTTEAATEAEIIFTLPAANTGPWLFWFFNAEDIDMKVTAETADTMVTFNDLEADSVSFETASMQIGGAFMVFSAGGSVVYAIPFGAGGHVQTLTVSS